MDDTVVTLFIQMKSTRQMRHKPCLDLKHKRKLICKMLALANRKFNWAKKRGKQNVYIARFCLLNAHCWGSVASYFFCESWSMSLNAFLYGQVFAYTHANTAYNIFVDIYSHLNTHYSCSLIVLGKLSFFCQCTLKAFHFDSLLTPFDCGY